jgi:hypothetical protein
MQYQDIDLDIVNTFKQVNVPVLVVVTQAFRAGVLEFSEEIQAHPVFEGVPVICVNSEPAVNSQGMLIQESFGLTELATFLEIAVTSGRNLAKPNALREMGRLHDQGSAITAQFDTEAMVRRQAREDQLTISELRPKNEKTQPLIEQIMSMVDQISE